MAVVLLIFAGGLLHRATDLGKIPPPHVTDDEYWYVWSGISLVTTGTPTSWTMLSGYGNRALGYGVWGTHSYFFVRPALDHPPLFSILAGTSAMISGADPVTIPLRPSGAATVWDFDLGKARWLSLLLFAVSFFLLQYLAGASLGFWPGCAALLVFAFAKPIVLHQRLLVADNLTTPLLLANLAILHRCLGDARRGTWLLAVATCVLVPLAALAKMVAICHAAVIAFVLIAHGRARLLWVPALACAIAAAGVASYAALQDWDLFWSVQSSQTRRFAGFNFLQRMMCTIPLVGHEEFSFVILNGWILIFAMALRRHSPRIAIAPIAYAMSFAVFSATQTVFGWHHLPFYPFLCIAYGWAVREVWQRPRGIACFTILGLLLFWVWHGLYSLAPQDALPLRTGYVALVAIMALVLIVQKGDNRLRLWLPRAALIALLCGGLYLEFLSATSPTIADWPELKSSTATDHNDPSPPWLMDRPTTK